MHRTLARNFVAACAIAASGATAQEAPKPARPPLKNLVIVTLDTVRADHLSCYGYFRDTTPRLDKLAAESLRFTRCLSAIAHTTPSHSSLFTSVYPFEHGVVSNFFTQPKEDQPGFAFKPSPTLMTFAQAMQKKGLRTGGFVSATPCKKITGLATGFDEWTEPEEPRRAASVTIADALKFIEKNGDAPFFLWVHFFDAHGPIDPPRYPPDEYLDHYTTDDQLDQWLAAREFPKEIDGPHVGKMPPSTSVNMYDGTLRFLDDQLAKLFARLRKPDLWSTTALVITADHGHGLGQHNFLGHGIVWDEQLHVPLMIRAPGIKPGVVDTPLSLIDVLPTVLGLLPEFADAAFLEQCRGSNVLADGYQPRPLFAMAPTDRGLVSFTTARWKLIRTKKGLLQLFDLAADPFELHDVSKQNADVVAALNKSLSEEITRQKRREKVHHADSTGDAVIDAKHLKELEALGYAQDESDGDETAGPPPKDGAKRPGEKTNDEKKDDGGTR